MRVSLLGSEHPTVASTLVNMGLVHQKLKSYEEAKVVFQRAILIYELFPTHTSNGVQPNPEIAIVNGYLKSLQELIDAAELLDDDSASHHSLSEKSVSSNTMASSVKVFLSL